MDHTSTIEDGRYRHVQILASTSSRNIGQRRHVRRRIVFNVPENAKLVCQGYRDLASISPEDIMRFAGPCDHVNASPDLKHGIFPMRLHAVLSNKAAMKVICWKAHGRSFHIVAPKVAEKLCESLLGIRRYPDFIKILGLWGFKRVKSGPDRASFYHEAFLFGMPHLTVYMRKMTFLQSTSYEASIDPDFAALHREFPLVKLPALIILSEKVVGTNNIEEAKSSHQTVSRLSPVVVIPSGLLIDLDVEREETDDGCEKAKSNSIQIEVNDSAKARKDDTTSFPAEVAAGNVEDEDSSVDSDSLDSCTLSMSTRFKRIARPLSKEQTIDLVVKHIENVVISFLSPAIDRRYKISENDKRRREQMAKLLYELLSVEALGLTAVSDCITMIDRINKTARNITLQYYNTRLEEEKALDIKVMRRQLTNEIKRVTWGNYQRVRLYDPKALLDSSVDC